MVTKNLSPFPKSDILWLLFGICYSLHTVMFLYYIFLTVTVGVPFPYSSIISTSKKLECVLYFLDVECSKAMVVFEVLGVHFVLTSFGYWTGLLLSVFSDFVCCPNIFSYLLWQRSFILSGLFGQQVNFFHYFGPVLKISNLHGS